MATITLTGTVVHKNGNPVPSILVVVSERQLRVKKKLAEDTTNGKGIFSLTLHDVADKTAYFVEVWDDSGNTLTSQGPFPVKTGARSIKMVLEDGRFKGEVIFKTREPELAAFVEEWRQGGPDKAITADDARYVAEQTGLPAGEAWRWMKAFQLEAETTSGARKMPAEALYGLLKQGLPGSIAALSALPTGEIENALKRAMDANLISDAVSVKDLVQQWNELLGSKSLSEKPEGMDASLGEILTIAGANANHQQKLMETFSAHTGSDEEFWTKVGTVIPNASKVARYRKAMQLTAFTGFQPVMMEALLAENTPENLHAVAALAGRDAADWEAFIAAASAQASVVPTFIKGSNEAERRQRYAAQLAKTTEAAFPEHAFFGRLSKLNATAGGFGSAKTDLQAFFTKNPGFEFKNAAVAALADGTGLDLSGIANHQNLLKELRSVRRMMAFTKNTNALQGLREAGLDSARAVASMPRSQFVEKHGAAFGSGKEAAQAHREAERKSSLATAIWAAGHPNLNVETAATRGNSEAGTVARGPGDSPTLRSFFGSLEACDCEHCLSVYSPAAYLTDILHFLASRSVAAYNELVHRRPDLPGLLLNCENTNTPLPYIDLVIELLEDFVSPPTTPTQRQTTLTSVELAANPEHSNEAAYSRLKTAVYPSGLPFNFPLEESRVYLSHLKQPRHQLMTCFFPGKEIAAFEDRHIAFECLGMSVQERDIITAQTTGDGTADSGAWNFFGFNKATGFRPIADPVGGIIPSQGTWLEALSGRVDVFLQQTGLRYVDLLALLSCDFINPKTGNAFKISIVSIDADDPATCQLDKLRLQGLEADDLIRLHRFIRLAQRLNWGFYDLDKALSSMGISGFNGNTPKDVTAYLTADQVRRLSQTEQLRRRFDCTVEEVLAIWFNLRADEYTDFAGDKPTPIPSIYEKLFRNKAILNPLNDALKADPAALSGSMDSLAASIQAALQIGDADYRLLRSTGTVAADGNLNLANLSACYRYVALARWTGLSISDLLTTIALSGTNPFANQPDTFAFLRKADFIQSSGFSMVELDYLLRDRFTEPSGMAPTETAMQAFIDEARAMPELRENTLAVNFSSAFGLTAKATDLLLIKNLKSADSPAVAMVQDFLLPGATDATRKSDYRKMAKAALLVNKFKISDEELEQILQHHLLIGCLDFNALPVVQTSPDWEGFEALVNLIRARDLLGFGTGNLFEVLGKAIDINPDKNLWLENLVRVSNWDLTTLVTLVGDDTVANNGVLKANFPDDFRNGDLVLRIKKALDALDMVGVSADTMKKVVLPDVVPAIASAIKQAVKAKYDEAQWRKIAKPLRDALREQQRSALVDYAVHRSDQWKSVEELYEYLLIDVEMKPVSMTSRLKQATCSVQLFVDRALMNLEHDSTNGTSIHLLPAQAEEWKTWRKIYRIWEANRKIFLYPENWIEPELRDDQTPFFREAASALLQNELTPETVEDAFRGYLEKLDEVARLEIVGMVHQEEPEEGEQQAIDILHVFGRTGTQPHKYFHRSLENGEWTPWLKIETDIDSDHLVPVIFNRRLCLFWLFFTQEAEEAKEINPNQNVPKTNFYWKIQVAWSEFRKNKWTGKKLSKNFVQSEMTNSKTKLEKLRKKLFVRTYLGGDKLLVHLRPAKVNAAIAAHLLVMGNETSFCQVSFMFENTASEPLVIPNFLPGDFSLLLPINTVFEAEQIKANSASTQSLTLQYKTVSSRDYIPVLKGIAHPSFSLAVEAGAAQPFKRPFIFQDSKNSFFIEPFSYQKPSLDHIRLQTDSPDVVMIKRSADQNWRQYIQPDVGSRSRMMDDDNLFDDELDMTETNNPPAAVALTQCIPTDEFEQDSQNDSGLDSDEISAPSLDPLRRVTRRYRFSTFYHPQVKNFVHTLNKSGVPGVLRRKLQEADDLISFQTYQPTPAVIGDPPEGIVDFAYGAPYSQYNWELFFHLPIHIACRLSADQRFEEARKWFHYVFDPTSGDEGGKERFWQFKPFHEEAGAPIETLADLLENQVELERQVEKWAANPFQPHVIARMRITAYMKFTVMKYVDNLLAWGDQLFRRDTIESINEATNLYILAAKILGLAPQKVPARTQRSDKNFNEIKDDLDPFSNVLVEIEGYIYHSAAGNEPSTGTASALGYMFYFGVPRNEYLLKYWETVADRLFKIRHSLNIEGVFRSLPLFEPPIDPALLVRAAAAGMDLNSLLNEVSGNMPCYRFAFMLQKANELANEVKGLGASLLSALEKRDAEALSLLRSGHEQHLLSAVLQVRERQVEEAKEQMQGLEKSKKLIEVRSKYFKNLKDYNRWETLSIISSNIASGLWPAVAGIEGIAAILSSYEAKIGSPTTVGVTAKAGEFSKHAARVMETVINVANATSGVTAYMGQRERKKEERLYQLELATKELEQIQHQILASEIRLAIAERERSNHQLQMEQSAEADEFMRSKFTNRQLFDWMAGQLSTLYFQTYQMAYDLAKQAEQCFHFEFPPENAPAPEYVKFGYWDSLKKGLLAGEKLQFDLRRLEMAHLEQNKREFEITKHVSLRQINPVAILTLRETGNCAFNLPEVLFDMDFAGHYKRRIKSVSVSIPCIAGPYTGLNATLRLTKNEYRGKANLADALVGNPTPFTAIAVSTGQNDSGLFELNFRDERYLPFEGAGAISEWTLELPEFRQFDYNTISDVVMHIRYTALEGTDAAFKTAVLDSVSNLIGEVLPLTTEESNAIPGGLFAIIDLQHDLPTEWHKAIQNTNSQGQHVLTIPDLQQFLPFYALTYVRNQKFEIADAQFFHTSEITAISLTETISLKNKEVTFKSTDLPDQPIQKAFLVIRFTLV